MSALEDVRPQCGSGSASEDEYDLVLHVAAVFIVLGASLFGAGFPVAAKKFSWLKVPAPVFFACKHFGTGVLVATAFVHLLPVAFGSLTEPCLPEFFTDTYPALAGVIMMTSMFLLFIIEMYLTAKVGGHSHGGPTGQVLDAHNKQHKNKNMHDNYSHKGPNVTEKGDWSSTEFRRQMPTTDSVALAAKREEMELEENFLKVTAVSGEPMPAWFIVFYEQYIRQRIETINMIKTTPSPSSHPRFPLQDEFGYDLKKVSTFDSDVTLLEDAEEQPAEPQLLRKMNMHISLLEGGILFHSIFVGITISITTEGFLVLLIAIVFHQMFEGVGLGSRIASVPYPKKSIRPWVLVFAFGLTCPIGQAIGLGTREVYDPESAYGLITVGVFNAISSGLLIYAALVNLLAEDFLSEEAMTLLTKSKRIEAFVWVMLGAIGMSIIGAFA